MWDNCFDTELISLVPSSPAELQRMADDVCALARRHAADPDFPSPYTREALAQGWVGRAGR